MIKNKKQPSKTAMLDMIRRGGIAFPPLTFRLLEAAPPAAAPNGIDAIIEGAWDAAKARFAVAAMALSTPKAFFTAISVLKASRLPDGCRPMVMMPFLAGDHLGELERSGMSGIDLCGNGVVIIPGRLFIARSGNKNCFSTYAPIKNVYRKNSSLVGRMLLSYPVLSSVKNAVETVGAFDTLAAAALKKPLTFATVSKVLAGMEQDLLVAREKGALRLLQPDVLLEKLALNYTQPQCAASIAVKVRTGKLPLEKLLLRESLAQNLPVMATGLSSVSRYAVMQRGEMLSIYCPGADDLLKRLPATASDRFPNLEIIETRDAEVYFDARREQGFCWASPVQTFLELMQGDKRDRETAQRIKTVIVDRVRTKVP